MFGQNVHLFFCKIKFYFKHNIYLLVLSCLKSLFVREIMQNINAKKIAQIVYSSSNVVDADVNEVVTDSRKAGKNSLFIALKGQNFDGHDFVQEVLEKGCPLTVVEKLNPNASAVRQIVVADSVEAYGKIGAYNRSLFQGKVIGLTGSAGKTTTKEEIKFLLSKFADVYATQGNHNNHIGVPETLCNLSMSAQYAVIEMGMSAPHEIEKLTSYVQPDIAIVTNVYPMHLEFFENFKGIAEAKAEIFSGLKKNGTAIINGDTNYADLLVARADEQKANVVLFGSVNMPEVSPEGEGCRVKAEIGGKKIDFLLSENGEHHVANALCALTLVDVLGLDVQKAAALLKDFSALPGRGQKVKISLPDKKGMFTLIDDSYSGQPEAMKIAVQQLGKMKPLSQGRKIAVLGKMAEIGSSSALKHQELGAYVNQADVDVVIGVCPEMKDMLSQLSSDKKQFYFENNDGLDEFLLNNLLQNNDILLIKGARYSSKLYQVAEKLLKYKI